jgi:predicted metal-binding membrane protein
MGAMAAGLWSYPTDLGLYVVSWVVMMTGMMVPSIVPTVRSHQKAVRCHRGRRAALVTSAAFVAGYLAVWSAAGLVPYALVRVGGGLDGGLLMGGVGRYLAAGVLAAAAAYQLTPPKRACLRRFCAPLEPMWEVGSGGRIGGLRTGLESGLWCVGCCWALMASLFALDLMSLTWIFVIWAQVMAERLLPTRSMAIVGVAAVLAALAIGVVVGAPIATIPGHGAPMRT